MSAARGSEKLLARDSFKFTQDHAARLQGIVSKHEAKFVKWWLLGQPDPDVVFAGIQVDRLDKVGSVIEALLGEQYIVNLDVFPYGIPYPDIFQINLRIGSPR